MKVVQEQGDAGGSGSVGGSGNEWDVEGDGVGNQGLDGEWIGGSADQRARLALLLLINGLCLYGYVLTLFALLSRLSTTVFAIVSGYVKAALVFVLLLSLTGSATGPRIAGMLLASLAVVTHFYHYFTSGSISSQKAAGSTCPDFFNDRGEEENATRGGAGRGVPLPQLPVFLRESTVAGSPSRSGVGDSRGRRNEEGVGSVSSPGHQAGHPRGLFVPLLGTRHGGGLAEAGAAGGGEGWGREDIVPGTGGSTSQQPVGDEQRSSSSSQSLSSSWPSSPSSPNDNAAAGNHDIGDERAIGSPSRFTWHWMGLRPAESSPRARRSMPHDSSLTRRAVDSTRLSGGCVVSPGDIAVPPLYPQARAAKQAPAAETQGVPRSWKSSGSFVKPQPAFAYGPTTGRDAGSTAASGSAFAANAEGMVGTGDSSSSSALPCAASAVRTRVSYTQRRTTLGEGDGDGSAPAASSRSFQMRTGNLRSDAPAAPMELMAEEKHSHQGIARRPAGQPASPSSSSSFSLHSFEIIDKEEEVWR